MLAYLRIPARLMALRAQIDALTHSRTLRPCTVKMSLARSTPMVIMGMTFFFRGLDENDTFYHGTLDAVCGNFAAASGRGSPFYLLDIHDASFCNHEPV